MAAFVRCQQEIWVLFFLYFSTIFTQNFMPIANLTGHQAFQLKNHIQSYLNGDSNAPTCNMFNKTRQVYHLNTLCFVRMIVLCFGNGGFSRPTT